MLREYLSKIADQFRTHLDTTEPINAQDFAGKVEDVAVRYNQLGFTSGREAGYNQGLEEGYEQGKPLGKLELLQDSEYMNVKVSGTAIAVNDVSPIEHSVGCKVESKNLLDPRSYADNSNQGTVRILDDGLVELSGALNGDTYAEITYNFVVTEPCILTLWFEEKYGWKVNAYLNDTSLNSMNETTISVTLSVGTHKLRLFQGYQSTSGTYIQLEKGTTATSYTSYVDLSTVEVKRYEGNLIDDTLKKMAGTNIYFGTQDFSKNFTTLFPGTYTLSAKVKDNSNFTLYVTDFENGNQNISGWSVAGTTECSLTINVSKTTKVNFKVYHSTFTDTSFLEWAKLEVGSTATPYVPYVAPTPFQANLDGTVEGITSVSPNMTLIPSNDGVVINANYLRDIDTYIDNLKTNVALTGGE